MATSVRRRDRGRYSILLVVVVLMSVPPVSPHSSDIANLQQHVVHIKRLVLTDHRGGLPRSGGCSQHPLKVGIPFRALRVPLKRREASVRLIAPVPLGARARDLAMAFYQANPTYPPSVW